MLELEGLRKRLFGGDRRQLVYKALDASMTRSRAIAQNMANVSTPGYQRKEVSFEEQVRKALEVKLKGDQTQFGHLEISKGKMIEKIKPEVYQPDDPTLPGEINNVDIDIEAAKLAENQIMYNFMTKFAGFNKMLSAIKGQAQ